MALPNLKGQNIQDTYQRVIHTDGTNIHNGTGSQLPISFNGNNVIISGSLSATEYIVTSSVTNVVFQQQSGSTIFGDTADDTHLFTGSLHAQAGQFTHFTASNSTILNATILSPTFTAGTNTQDITCSGHLTFPVATGGTANITSNENLTINIENVNDLNSTIFKVHNLTSGKDVLKALEEGVLYIGGTGGDAAIASYGNMTFTIDTDGNETNQKFQFKNNTSILATLHESDGYNINTNITSSGNISASGKLIGIIDGGRF